MSTALEVSSPVPEASEPTAAKAESMQTDTVARRHDLDALRAIAMLLGIVLHSALSFAPIPWSVSDSQQSGLFGILFGAIHGFRMPLFFLISGFFTAMLWRKRGLKGLIVQRLKRILLPLGIGCLTIVPAMWGVEFFIQQASAPAKEHESERGIQCRRGL